MVMVVLTSMSGLWTEACASPGAPADEPGVQDGSQQIPLGHSSEIPALSRVMYFRNLQCA